VAYEAESAALAGAAVVAACGGCSGGKKVGYLGNGAGNRVTFLQVDAGWSGDHVLTVHGVSADPRTFSVSVNGAAPAAVSIHGQDWSTPATAAITVHLDRETNSVVLTNVGEYAPDLDRIVVW
jgi:hypothetical protein